MSQEGSVLPRPVRIQSPGWTGFKWKGPHIPLWLGWWLPPLWRVTVVLAWGTRLLTACSFNILSSLAWTQSLFYAPSWGNETRNGGLGDPVLMRTADGGPAVARSCRAWHRPTLPHNEHFSDIWGGSSSNISFLGLMRKWAGSSLHPGKAL